MSEEAMMLKRYSRVLMLCGVMTAMCGSGGGPFLEGSGCSSSRTRNSHSDIPDCAAHEDYHHDGARWICVPKGPCATDQGLYLVTPEACDPCGLNLPVSRAINGCKDLEGVDLDGWFAASGYLQGVDLSDANLSGANMNQADLLDADLSGANLEGANLTAARLIRANLEGAVLADADLFGAYLGDANLAGVVWAHTRCPDGTVSDDGGGTCCGHLNGARPGAGCDAVAAQ